MISLDVDDEVPGRPQQATRVYEIDPVRGPVVTMRPRRPTPTWERLDPDELRRKHVAQSHPKRAP